MEQDFQIEQGIHTSTLYKVLAALLLIAGITYGGYVLFLGTYSPSRSLKEVMPAVESVLSGDKLDAARQASEFLASHQSGDAASALAQRIVASSAYTEATTSEARVAAVRLMKEGYVSASTPDAKALMINLIANALVLNADLPGNESGDVAFEEAFDGEPFQSFYVRGARGQSIQNLLEYSLTLYPIDQSYYLWTVIAERGIEKRMLTKAPSDKDRGLAQKTAQRIRTYIEAGDALGKKNAASIGISGLDRLAKAQNDLFRGLGYSGVVFVDPSALADAEAAFTDVINDVQSAKAANESSVALGLEEAYAHLYTARIVNQVSGASRASDIRAHLAAFVATTAAAPQDYKDIYRMFAWLKDAPEIPANQREGNRQYQLYTSYKALAGVSPEFKSFLLAQGWSF